MICSFSTVTVSFAIIDFTLSIFTFFLRRFEASTPAFEQILIIDMHHRKFLHNKSLLPPHIYVFVHITKSLFRITTSVVTERLFEVICRTFSSQYSCLNPRSDHTLHYNKQILSLRKFRDHNNLILGFLPCSLHDSKHLLIFASFKITII